MANFRPPDEIPALVDRALQGDRRALSRLLSRVENGGAEAWSAMALIYPRTGRAQIVGVTGAPGTGKSTLVNELAKAFRRSPPLPPPQSGGGVGGGRTVASGNASLCFSTPSGIKSSMAI